MRACSAPPEPRPGHHGSNRTTPPGPTSNVPSPRSPPRTGAGSSYATSAPPPTTPGYTPAAPRSTYALCSGTALPARTGPGRSPETPRQAPRHGLQRLTPAAEAATRSDPGQSADPEPHNPPHRTRVVQRPPREAPPQTAERGGGTGRESAGRFILTSVETDPGGDRRDRFAGGSGCDQPGGGERRGHGVRSRRAGHLVSGPLIRDRFRGQAADPWWGGVLPARSPGSADRVPGIVRADRGEVPPGHEGLGAGQRGAGGDVQGRRSQGRGDAPLPGAGGRRGSFEGGGHRPGAGVCPGVDRDQT